MISGLGQWLRERCEADGLSLRDAAARVGVNHGTIAKIMDGASPSPQTFRRLVRAFAFEDTERLALEDRLLVLAGYRTPRPDEKGRGLLAVLIDKVSSFDEPRLRRMIAFADSLTRTRRSQAYELLVTHENEKTQIAPDL